MNRGVGISLGFLAPVLVCMVIGKSIVTDNKNEKKFNLTEKEVENINHVVVQKQDSNWSNVKLAFSHDRLFDSVAIKYNNEKFASQYALGAYEITNINNKIQVGQTTYKDIFDSLKSAKMYKKHVVDVFEAGKNYIRDSLKHSRNILKVVRNNLPK